MVHAGGGETVRPNIVCRCQIEKKGCSFPGRICEYKSDYWVEDGGGVDYQWVEVRVSVDLETYRGLTPRLKKMVEVKG